MVREVSGSLTHWVWLKQTAGMSMYGRGVGLFVYRLETEFCKYSLGLYFDDPDHRSVANPPGRCALQQKKRLAATIPKMKNLPDYASRTLSNPLYDFVERHPRLFVLSGAGISTESGIPCYRDTEGQRTGRAPILLKDFLGSEFSRKRWACLGLLLI